MVLVEAVVINYLRPDNVSAIVSALRAQNTPIDITIIDASLERRSVPVRARDLADRVVRVEKNHGGYNRYVYSILFEKPFTFFIDDDIVPGPRCVATFLHHAVRHPDYGVLGQFGRFIEDGQYNFKYHRAKRNMREVDFVVESYFVRREVLAHHFSWKKKLGLSEVREDDLLICSAARDAGYKVGVIPVGGREERMDLMRLPQPFALNRDPNHQAYRTKFIQLLMQHGWTSVTSRSKRTVMQVTDLR
jgi:hypothetical protein